MSHKRRLLACALILTLREEERKERITKSKPKRKHRFWVNPFLAKRNAFDIENSLLTDLLLDPTQKDYTNFVRLTYCEFEEILEMVSPLIIKENTQMRYAITPRVRLAITLRFLASGDSYKSLEFLTRVSEKTISAFVPKVLSAIYTALQPKYLKMPSTTNEWNEISDDYFRIWNFPNTLGAMDGKHFRIKKPANSGSLFYNYKGYYSIVMLAIVDAYCRFIFIDVGSNGRCSDSTIYSESYIYKRLKSGTLGIPNDKCLPGSTTTSPFFFVVDDAFAQDKHAMKPFNRNTQLTIPQKIYNYRICRARLTSECAFGRLTNRFRIFLRPIEVTPETCDLAIKASCVLHNFLLRNIKPTSGTENELEVDHTPNTVTSLTRQESSSYKYSYRIKEKLVNYCVSEGNVSFQWDKI